jgi:hypothetical protein
MRHFLVGIIGVGTALTLHQWSDIATIAAGASTTIYMVICGTLAVYRHFHKP